MSAPERVQVALSRVAALSQPRQPHAVVVGADTARLARCLTYAEQHGYTVSLADATVALSMIAAGTADVIVAASPDDLPYVEIAGSRGPVPVQPSGDPERAIWRRPRPVRQLRGPFGD